MLVPQSMPQQHPAEAARAILLERLRDDLLGPSSSDEIISQRPSDRYLSGALFPIGKELPAHEDEGMGTEGDEEASEDEPVPVGRTLKPSSCGLSFAVAPASGVTVRFLISCARYERFYIDPADGELSTHPDIARRANERWRRIPLTAERDIQIGFDKGLQQLDLSEAGFPGLELFVRTSVAQKKLIVTAALVNKHKEPERDRVESERMTFFQVSLRVTPVAPATLRARPARSGSADKDSRISELIYRDVREYAVGHTCSASWDTRGEPPEWVQTEWLPQASVRRMRPEGDPIFASLRASPHLRPLEAGWNAEANDADLVEGLSKLPELYEAWLTKQSDKVSGLEPALQVTAKQNLEECRKAAARIRSSIDLLQKDPNARAAWRLSAGAMRLQFRWTKKGKELVWHPFQLAFQLLVVRSLVDPESEDRHIMDLLWFPTGGGKTEAYLALTAFLLFYRRLHFGPEAGSGSTVLMRYTLRLLTIQQFQRAAALILACEAIRRGHEQVASESARGLGSTPFSIGLWVGGQATPNRFDGAKQALARGGASSPRQLERCPRCQARLDYTADPSRRAILIRCTGEECYFADRRSWMPLWVVDEDIYREKPGLVIATADKLTQVVRVEASRVLFGLGTPHLPPGLIIQDELHLISGPLGSLAGLFEVAVDRLCSREVKGKLDRPKVIGSTATIRRAEEQVRALFDRGVLQFPPPVIDARNSGFGIEDEADPGRLYLGVTTAGRSAKYSIQATYASLLQAADDRRIDTLPGNKSAKDIYWTLTGYFNSLRELGGAVTLVMDDVQKSLKGYATRHGDAQPRSVAFPLELTSRVPSSDIPHILEALERKVGESTPVDVLLATNMISVGVDIQRLGLMVVAAQPKTISEYIQATSRVGRHAPGLVVVVYNHPRIRDRSHFETFATWHRALYRSVEGSSVTPFASRARDKALHAVVVALARHLVDALRSTPSLTPMARAEVEELAASVISRAEQVDAAEAEGVRRKLKAFLDDWSARTEEGVSTYWDERNHPKSLLIGAELAATLDEEGIPVVAWPTPNSMREVEPSSLFRLYTPNMTRARSRRRTTRADE